MDSVYAGGMLRRVTFLRHAMPQVNETQPPGDWVLSPAGIAAAVALRVDGSAATAVSSPERKAVQTVAHALSLPESAVATDSAFREIDRVEQVHADFRDTRRAWIAGLLDERHEGWETPDAAAQRFHEGLLGHPAEHLIVSTHGMVLTAWLLAQGLIERADDAVVFWDALRLPDVLEVSVPLLRVRAVLTDAEGRVVLIKRTQPGQAPYWTTPGGGMMLADSSPEDALRRELREELGATAEVGDVIHERQLDSIRREILYTATLSSIDPGLADGPEFDDPSRGAYEVEFVTRDEMRAVDLRPGELNRIRLARH